jgi:hypothetical protein
MSSAILSAIRRVVVGVAAAIVASSLLIRRHRPDEGIPTSSQAPLFSGSLGVDLYITSPPDEDDLYQQVCGPWPSSPVDCNEGNPAVM